jgi:hypothetical protein
MTFQGVGENLPVRKNLPPAMGIAAMADGGNLIGR